MRVKHAEILRDQFFIVGNLGGIACKHAAPGIEDDCLIGHLERQLQVLFDQDDGLSFLLQPFYGAADLGHDQRRKTLGWFVEQDEGVMGDDGTVVSTGIASVGPYAGKLDFSTFARATGGEIDNFLLSELVEIVRCFVVSPRQAQICEKHGSARRVAVAPRHLAPPARVKQIFISFRHLGRRDKLSIIA